MTVLQVVISSVASMIAVGIVLILLFFFINWLSDLLTKRSKEKQEEKITEGFTCLMIIEDLAIRSPDEEVLLKRLWDWFVKELEIDWSWDFIPVDEEEKKE